ncbi:Retrovirus-related Pol poly from transposon, partial [Paramuricea clavata]
MEEAKLEKISQDVRNDGRRIEKRRTDEIVSRCWTCGGSGHSRQECRRKNVTCFNCGKIGHLAQVCRSERKFTSRPTQRFDKATKINEVKEFEEIATISNET